MNEMNAKSLLAEIAALEVPVETDLWPEIHRRIPNSWPLTARKDNFRRQLVAAGVLAAAVLLLVVLFTPQGRTFAQQVAQFFSRVQGHTLPAPKGQGQFITPAPLHYLEIVPVDPQAASQMQTDLPILPGCEDPAARFRYRCQIAAAEFVGGFDAKEMPSDPVGLAFERAEVDPADRSITIQYTNGNPSNINWLSIAQGVGKFPSEKFGRVPADEGEAVYVKGAPGEYVSGAFVTRGLSDYSTWNSDAGIVQRLAWRAGNRWFVIGEAVTSGQPGYMDKEALIKLAESLVQAAPQSQQEGLRPEILHSLAEAESLAGFSLRSPSRLPSNFVFYNAQLASRLSQVSLLYFSPTGSWLEIIQTPGEKFNFAGYVAARQSAEKVEIKGQDGWYINRDAKSPMPIFLEGDAQEGLFWEEGGVVYRILFSPSSDSGDRLGKMGMVAIANSLIFPGK